MKAAIYLRVSTREQSEEGFSIRAQKQRLEAYVESQNWKVWDYYIDEGFSAKDTERPQLKRLLNDLDKFDVVLVYRLDRLTRSVLDLYKLLETLEAHNVKFKSSTELFDTTTATGRMFITLVAALAQWERENLSERVSMGMKRMVSEGKWHGGNPPFGIKLKDGNLTLDEQEAPVVKRIFNMYVSGIGAKTIAITLNREGIKTRQNKSWVQSVIGRMVKSKTYVGTYNYDGTELENYGPQVIDQETFDQAQKINQSRQGKHPRQVSSQYAFSGVLKCSRCGSSIYPKTSNRHGKKYVYYICKGRDNKTCDLPYLADESMHDAFIENIEVFAMQTESDPIDDVDHEALDNELKKIEVKKDRMQVAYREGVIELADLKNHKKEMDLRITEINNELDTGSTQIDLSLVYDIKENWRRLSEADKKQFVTSAVNKIVVDAENKHSHRYNSPRKVLISNVSFV